TSDGDVWLWGPNDRGPSGGLDGDAALETDASFFPVRMTAFDAPFVVEIQTGPNSLIAVTDTGEILTLGSNSDGRLGYATDGPTTEPQAVDFEADTAPFLLAATPGDNGRDVQVDANLELVFTEAVTAGGGAVRVVNRDDPEDAVEVSAAAASIDGAAVTIDLPGRLTPGARYDVRIDDDAFFDLAGQPYGGLDAGDVGDFDFRVMQAVEGSDGADRLSGGDRAEVIAGGAGRSDLLAGGGGADIFRFGDETSNGVREMDQIRDYDAEQGDRIDLGGAEIASIRETSRFVTLTLEGDGDAVMIRGVASFEDLVFV
ncbi:MAG: Ig-like domain-containing protein, partial [Pseudomonadota bacterium]